MITTEVADGVGAVGPEWDVLFDLGPGVQSRRTWFHAVEAAALPGGQRAHFVMVLSDGRPTALLPLQVGKRVASLTTPYTVLFQPLLASDADVPAVGVALGRYLRRWSVVRLEALDGDWPGLVPLLAGLRQGGMLANRFDHFGNWHERVAGLDWAAYLAGRPGALRETIRRRGRAAAKDATIGIEVVRGLNGLDQAMAAYEEVYARSWKVPEPFPRFNAALLPLLARMGVLRLGVMRQGGRVLAAQYWTVLDGVATVLKLAHDEEVKALSPGTLLTAHMIRTLLEEGGIEALDFGRGDDPYKRDWVASRRQRIGVVLANPRRAVGLFEVVRHRLGELRRRGRGRAG